MHKTITSFQNPLIKQIILLQEKSRERRKSGLFIIEGLRETFLAKRGGYQLKTLLYCPSIITEEKLAALANEFDTQSDFIGITPEVYEKLSYRSSTEGILAIARTKDLSLMNLDTSNWFQSASGSLDPTLQKTKKDKPLILIAEAPEKPGNIGALLRTADAANLHGVIIANPKTDMYNPNIIRSSVGGVFTNNIATGSTEEIISFLKKHKINIFCAALQASVPYHSVDFSGPSAIVVGTEATGLAQEWLKQSTQNILIPMSGELDSMNVSVAAAILIFEAKRQRLFS